MKKILCALTSLIMILAISSCGEKSEESSVSGTQLIGGTNNKKQDVSESNLPYGATVYELSADNDDYVKVIVDFDKRYFVDSEGNPNLDEIHKIHDYIIAIDTNDHDLFKSITYPEFYETYCKENDITFDEYIDSTHNALKEIIGENSSINYIDISDCIFEGEAVQEYYNLRDEILEKIGAGNITSRKMVEVGGYTTFHNDSGSFMLTNYGNAFLLCVYEINGQLYIL